MQLFLMVVKGMFGSMGKWALDEDSWKQLQIPAQKLTSKPSPHIANLVVSRNRVISVQQQMLKPQNLAQLQAWFDLAVDDKYMRKLDKYCKILCSRLQLFCNTYTQ